MHSDSFWQHNVTSKASDMLTLHISLIKSHSNIRSRSKQTFSIGVTQKDKSLL